MKQRHVTIRSNGVGRGTIALDGQELAGIVHVQFDGRPTHHDRVTLDVSLLHGATVDTLAEVWLRPETAATLIALGWTPPDPIYLATAADADERHIRYREDTSDGARVHTLADAVRAAASAHLPRAAPLESPHPHPVEDRTADPGTPQA